MQRVLILSLALLLILGASLTLALSFSSPSASKGGSLEVVGHIGGGADTVFVEGNRAYVGIGSKFVILDVSDTNNWVRLGQVILPTDVSAIRVANHYAYVVLDGGESLTNEHDGIQLIDVSDPTAPTKVSFYQPFAPQTQGIIRDLIVEDNYAYIALGSHGLRVLDVSVPTALSEVGSYNTKTFSAGLMAIKNNYIYVRNGLVPFTVLNVSNPAAPVLISSYDIDDSITNFTIAGNYLYLGKIICIFPGPCHSLGIEIVDISNPATPTKVSSYDSLNIVYDIDVAGNYAYLSGGSALEVVNISNIKQPVQAFVLEDKTWSFLGKTESTTIEGNQIYMATGDTGVRMVDISDPAMPILSEYSYNRGIGFETYQDLVVTDNYLYGAGRTGLQIIDTHSPAYPSSIGYYNNYPNRDTSYASLTSVAVKDNYAYFAWYYSTCRGGHPLSCLRIRHINFNIVNISDPTTPMEVGSYRLRESFRNLPSPLPVEEWAGDVAVAVTENYAYVAEKTTLWVMDVSEPTSPTVAGSVDLPTVVSETIGTIHDIALADDYVYLALGERGLRVIDVSRPTEPTEVGSYQPPSSVNDVMIVNQLAYVPTSEHGLRVLNITDPTHPVEVGFLQMPDSVSEITIIDNYAYLHVGTDELQVINLNDPTAPVVLDSIEMENPIISLASNREHLYVGSSENGLSVLRVVEPEAYSITGQVLQPNGMPFIQREISLSTSQQLTTTDATGFYTFTTPYSGTYTITPMLTGYSFIPPTRTVILRPSAKQQDFIIVPNPVSVTIMPKQNNTLTYTDTQGLPTRLELPANTVNETTTLRLQPTLVSDHSSLLFAGHAFDLTASQNGANQPDLTFAEPVTATIHYSEVDVPRPANENELALHWWDGFAWVDAATTCTPESSDERDLNQNMLTVSICQVGRYALFGPTNQLFLPVTLKNSPPIHIIAKHSQKCLHVQGPSDANAAPVIQSNCSNLDNQRLRLVPEGDYFRIVAQHSGKCLHVQEGIQASGAPLIQGACLNIDHQLWTLTPVGDYFQLVAKHSGKCLDVQGASDASEAPAIQWDCTAGDNQLWRIERFFLQVIK